MGSEAPAGTYGLIVLFLGVVWSIAHSSAIVGFAIAVAVAIAWSIWLDGHPDAVGRAGCSTSR